MGLSQANVAQLAMLDARLKTLYNSLVVEVDRFNKAARSGAIPDERDCADGAYLCKLMSEQLDYLRKECNKACQAASQWACEQWTIKQLSDPNLSDKIHAQLCTATTKVDNVVNVPKKDTEEYSTLCHDLGLTEWSTQHDIFHIHWPGIVALCKDRLQRGLPLPKGLDKRLVKGIRGLEFSEVKDMTLSFRKAKD